jgi:hypothetical protein
VLPIEKTTESSCERWSFVVRSIGMKDEGTFWCGEIRSFFVGQSTPDQGCRHVGHLITIDESESVLRFDNDAIKEIELGDLQYMLDRAELGAC